jgi:conjugative transfer pilus assembly protein TraH
MQDPFFQADPKFAEVIMNIIGTVIISDAGATDDAPSAVMAIRPAIDGDIQSERFRNIYTALLMGKKATSPLQIYRCADGAVADPKACTTMSASPETITPSWTGLYDKVESLVSSIIDRIYSDKTPLTAEQHGFISSTSISLYRYLVATAAYFPRGTNVSRYTDNYTALIAQDILLRALNAVIANVDQRSGMLKDGMSASVRVKAFREDLEGVLQGFAQMQKENNFDAEQLFRMQQRIQLYEKALMSRLGSGFISNAMWGQ